MENSIALAALSSLGFSETEAAVYCELLERSATGYRLAQAIGKSPPNIYHALGALHQKGAVMVDDSEGRVYRAVPPAELLGALGEQFALRREQALSALSVIRTASTDDRVYHLKGARQAYGRAREIIAGAREILLFDCFPRVFAVLVADLRAAAARGVTVAGVVYDEAWEPGLRLVRSRADPVVTARWPGDQLSVVADAAEYLLALLSPDGRQARHALWSDGAYLSALQHNGLASEIRLSALVPEEDDALADLALLRAQPPGLRALTGEEEA
jgi:HTH-type transcriptional regulator, sugar sensing transcriptional regulator